MIEARLVAVNGQRGAVRSQDSAVNRRRVVRVQHAQARARGARLAAVNGQRGAVDGPRPIVQCTRLMPEDIHSSQSGCGQRSAVTGQRGAVNIQAISGWLRSTVSGQTATVR